MSFEKFAKKHFKGIEKETWYPAIVAIGEGYIREQDKKDLEFLKEMREKTQDLINGRYDITKVEYLDQMIIDWIDELETKNKKP